MKIFGSPVTVFHRAYASNFVVLCHLPLKILALVAAKGGRCDFFRRGCARGPIQTDWFTKCSKCCYAWTLVSRGISWQDDENSIFSYVETNGDVP